MQIELRYIKSSQQRLILIFEEYDYIINHDSSSCPFVNLNCLPCSSISA
ncbi:hypothetical protein ODU37_04505 [Streptococcus sp. 2021WUSS109]